LLLSILTTGCSGIAEKVADVALGGPEKGVEVDANVGQAKTEGESSVAQNANTAVSVDAGSQEVFEGTVGQVINENGLKWWELMVLVLLAGWAIPSPAEMLESILRAVLRPLAGVRRNRSEPPKHQ
jgi:hypothetical protein